MKKILTLVLALALVFALAAPALAITGDTTPDETHPSRAPVSLDVELFTAPEAFGGGTLSVSKIASNKMYIVNEVAYWGVALQFADENDYNFNMHENDYNGAELTVSCDAFALKDVALGHAYVEEAGKSKIVKWNKALGEDGVDDGMDFDPPELSSNKDYLEMGIPDYLWGTDTELYFFGQGIVTGKGLLKAEVALDSSLDDGVLMIYDGTDLLYKVDDDQSFPGLDFDSGYVVWDDEDNAVGFEVDNGNVTAIKVALKDILGGKFQEVEYKTKPSGGGSIVQSIGDFEGDDLDEAKKLYNSVMKFFGFNYDAEGKLRDKHFESKCRALYLKDQATINLYTGSIVIPDPEVAPPKTGDAASVMGFMMIALALAAAGVVVAKKKIRA